MRRFQTQHFKINRMLPPAYQDGVSEPRVGYDGLPLPSGRFVTSAVHYEEQLNDHAATTLVVSLGQFLDHDFTLTGTMLSNNQIMQIIY
jgi:hypothetical protein